jgi:catechol 2,3-dioxygenase-like lactoylglutathione lyase family enzyme
MIHKVHHSAYRCRDSEQTRRFYEDFLGLPLVCTLALDETKTGRAVDALHTFFRLDDGSCLAFFEVPAMPFVFKEQHDYDLHIALEVDRHVLETMLEKARALGIESRGISDHELFCSVYFRDPNGYVVELCAKTDSYDARMDPRLNGARELLERWTRRRRPPVTS